MARRVGTSALLADLLAALRRIQRLARDHVMGEDINPEVYGDIARAAIARAEGR